MMAGNMLTQYNGEEFVSRQYDGRKYVNTV